jgi:hypothetical protein
MDSGAVRDERDTTGSKARISGKAIHRMPASRTADIGVSGGRAET